MALSTSRQYPGKSGAWQQGELVVPGILAEDDQPGDNLMVDFESIGHGFQ